MIFRHTVRCIFAIYSADYNNIFGIDSDVCLGFIFIFAMIDLIRTSSTYERSRCINIFKLTSIRFLLSRMCIVY